MTIVAGFIFRFLVFILKMINGWLFILPSRLKIIATVAYYFIFDFLKGDQPIYLFKRALGGEGSWGNFLLFFALGFPMIWSIACTFASFNVGQKIQSSLDATIQFRNGQMSISNSKRASQILNETAALDLLKSNEQDGIFKAAADGFRSQNELKPPSEVYNQFVRSDKK